MTKHDEDYKATCPYYKWNDNNRIACEGLYDDGSALHLTFSTKRKLIEHMTALCRSRYAACPICAMHDKRYYG